MTARIRVYVGILATFLLACALPCFPAHAGWHQTTKVPEWPARFGHSAFVFDNRFWVLGGGSDKYGCGAFYFGDVWYSRDAKTWTEATYSAPWGRRFGQGAVVFDGKMWVMGGTRDFNHNVLFNDVWCSSDGVD